MACLMRPGGAWRLEGIVQADRWGRRRRTAMDSATQVLQDCLKDQGLV